MGSQLLIFVGLPSPTLPLQNINTTTGSKGSFDCLYYLSVWQADRAQTFLVSLASVQICRWSPSLSVSSPAQTSSTSPRSTRISASTTTSEFFLRSPTRSSRLSLPSTTLPS